MFGDPYHKSNSKAFFQYIRKPRKKKKAVLMIDIFPAGADMQVVCI